MNLCILRDIILVFHFCNSLLSFAQSRSVCEHMEFTCIAPVEATRFPLSRETTETVVDDHQHWQCRRVVTSLSATLNDLRYGPSLCHLHQLC